MARQTNSVSDEKKKHSAVTRRKALIVGGWGGVFGALRHYVMTNFAKGLAVTFPAEMFPGVAKLNERVGQVVFQAFGAVGDLLDAVEDFLFVGRAVHAPKLARGDDVAHPAEVPNW
jgi:hypothetical protein